MMKVMKQSRRSEYFFRHFKTFWRYLSLRKILNLILNIIEFKFRISAVHSFPVYLKIEPTPLCQLRCPSCRHGSSLYNKQFQKGMQITLEQFKQIVNPLSPTLLGISLSNYGEPLLHRDIISLIEYAHRRNIAVSFPTNLSLKLSKDWMEELVNSGLDSFLVSLDGATEETYNKYRVGGNFSLILQNVKAISEIKRKLKLNHPYMIWKFVIFNHNQHEVSIVLQKYREWGFDSYEFVENKFDPELKESRKAYMTSARGRRKGCFWAWHTMVIQWDGEVSPCCSPKPFDIGNAIKEDVVKIWRSEQYNKLRLGLSAKKYIDKVHPVCRKCILYTATI